MILIKLLFTVLVGVLVWYALKNRKRVTSDTLGRFGRAASAAGREMAASARARQAGENPPPPGPATAQDLVACPRCGAYAPVGMACTCVKAEK